MFGIVSSLTPQHIFPFLPISQSAFYGALHYIHIMIVLFVIINSVVNPVPSSVTFPLSRFSFLMQRKCNAIDPIPAFPFIFSKINAYIMCQTISSSHPLPEGAHKVRDSFLVLVVRNTNKERKNVIHRTGISTVLASFLSPQMWSCADCRLYEGIYMELTDDWLQSPHRCFWSSAGSWVRFIIKVLGGGGWSLSNPGLKRVKDRNISHLHLWGQRNRAARI